MVDFEIFRPLLSQALHRLDGSLLALLTGWRGIGQSPMGGQPPIDPIVMFKILILQALYGLSDEQAEFQIIDRQKTIDPFPAGTAARKLRRGIGFHSCAFSAWAWRTGAGLLDDLAVWRSAAFGSGSHGDGRCHARIVRPVRPRSHRAGLFCARQPADDASIVEAPRQRLTIEEKQVICSGKRPDRPAARPGTRTSRHALGGLPIAVPSGNGSFVC